MPWFDDGIDELNRKVTGAEYIDASREAKEGSESIITGIGQLQNGDSQGGAASILNGIGQLATMGTLLGPAGAAAGGILSLLTGIIAAIMELLNPEKESLEQKIEKILQEDTLKKWTVDLKGAETSWREMCENKLTRLAFTRKTISEQGKDFKFDTNTMFMLDDQTPEQLLLGISWERFENLTNYTAEVKNVNTALQLLMDYLEEHPNAPSQKWGALLDQTVGYMFRLWVSLHGGLGLMDVKGYGTFREELNDIAKGFKAKLEEMEFAMQNHRPVYTRWHTGSADYFDGSAEPIYRRLGVTLPEWTRYDEVASSKVYNFAVSSRGTIFSTIERVEYPIFSRSVEFHRRISAGQQGTDWLEEKGDLEFQQVFIGEIPSQPDVVLVAGIHDNSNKISMASFTDKYGFGDDQPYEWKPNEARWGDWQLNMAYNFKIAAVAITAVGTDGSYAIYAIGLNNDLSATLYDLRADSTAIAVEGFHWTADEVQKSGAMNLIDSNDSSQWSKYPSYSCSISLHPLTAQLGSLMKIKEGEKIVDWDLRGASFLYDEALKTHQAKFYSDGTLIVCSNKGVHMRYWDSRDGGQFKWVNDATNEGEALQKIPLHNAGQYRALQERFNALETEKATAGQA